jgi:lipopolysaccharide biosynthesis glycosyltransferase
MKEANAMIIENNENNENNEIPIVFITDNNYVLPTGVAITSLVLNKKPEAVYKIYVIVTEDVTAGNRSKLIDCGGEKARVTLIEMDAGVLNEYAVPGYYVPPCDLLKFNIPGLLPQYEKILYLDGDILVYGDLAELYGADISGVYLGAVSDFAAIVYGFHKRLGIVNYFNAGCLLLNSARMRREGFEELLYRIKKQNPDYRCMDQDMFNVAVKSKIVFSPVKYNVMLHHFLYSIRGGIAKLNEYYGTSYKSFDLLLKDAVIVHLTYEHKPWKYKDAVMHKEWMSYFLKSPFRTQKLSLVKKETFKERIKHTTKIIIRNLPVIKQINTRYSELRNTLNKNNEILERLERLNQNIYREISAGKNNTPR